VAERRSPRPLRRSVALDSDNTGFRERQMSIDADVLNSEPAHLLSTMYASEYSPQSLLREPSPVPSMLNALGACAGFAAQIAVWRELVLPAKRNPGEFFVYAITKSRETFFFGEAINLFLFSMMPDRVSFLSLAAAALASASDLFDISELASHVSLTLGTEGFGRPRACPSVHVPELPRRWSLSIDNVRHRAL
jgi:hypothetical protein